MRRGTDAMTVDDEPELQKIVIELEYHWAGIGGEGVWARPLGNDLYELDNVPLYAYGLNIGDVVCAIAPGPERKPVVQRLERSGGHHTLRVHFTETVAACERVLMLRGLERFQVSYEGQDTKFFALDVAPRGDYEGVIDQLQAWEDQRLLAFETCEKRVEAGFGSDPDEEGS
jgi:hypothetical protein